jgi:glutathionylspermidine synthase
VHFTCVRDHDEDRGTVDYLRDTATQAGLDAPFLFIDDIGWNGQAFTDLEERRIEALFKLYPWEGLMREEFAAFLAPSGLRVIEPAWKMVLANKAILSLLWHMFPDHPNLLPAYLEPGRIAGPAIAKPLLGREGEDVRAVTGSETGRAGTYGAEGFVYQALAPLPQFGGRHPVVGSWVIASQPAGIGIREDDDPITRNTSRFVPHLFR